MSRGHLIFVCALIALQVSAKETKRCTYGAAGDLVGTRIYINSTLLKPFGRRQYTQKVPKLFGCDLNGVSAKVCDLFAPDVVVDAALHEVRVRRLGPRLHPLTLEFSLYCDPEKSPHLYALS